MTDMLQLTYSPFFTVPMDLKPHEQRWAWNVPDGPVQRQEWPDGSWKEWVGIKLIGWVRG